MRWTLILVMFGGCTSGHEPGPPLTLVEDEPPDMTCAAGGARTVTGTDEDGSGTLEPDEISATTIVCTTPVVRYQSLVLRSADDAQQLAGVTELVGTLTIESTALPLELPDLVRVDGTLTCNGAATRHLGIPRLTEVTGTLESYCDPDASHVQTVGSELIISPGAGAHSLFPELRSVGGALGAIGSDTSTTIELPALTSIGGGLGFAGALTFVAPRLTRTAYISAAGALQSISLPALTRVDGAIEIIDTPIARLELPALRELSSMVITHNPQLCGSVVADLIARTGAPAVAHDNGDC